MVGQRLYLYFWDDDLSSHRLPSDQVGSARQAMSRTHDSQMNDADHVQLQRNAVYS